MLPGQIDLFSWKPRARRSDPDTSQEAGKRAAKFAGKQHKQILDVMTQAGIPLSAEQIADRIQGADHVKIARRTSELLQAGAIVVADSDYINRSGSRARRYAVAASDGGPT